MSFLILLLVSLALASRCVASRLSRCFIKYFQSRLEASSNERWGDRELAKEKITEIVGWLEFLFFGSLALLVFLTWLSPVISIDFGLKGFMATLGGWLGIKIAIEYHLSEHKTEQKALLYVSLIASLINIVIAVLVAFLVCLVVQRLALR